MFLSNTSIKTIQIWNTTALSNSRFKDYPHSYEWRALEEVNEIIFFLHKLKVAKVLKIEHFPTVKQMKTTS